MLEAELDGNTFISIHAAREGGDQFDNMYCATTSLISIHAAREGGDKKPAGTLHSDGYFNPRRP